MQFIKKQAVRRRTVLKSDSDGMWGLNNCNVQPSISVIKELSVTSLIRFYLSGNTVVQWPTQSQNSPLLWIRPPVGGCKNDGHRDRRHGDHMEEIVTSVGNSSPATKANIIHGDRNGFRSRNIFVLLRKYERAKKLMDPCFNNSWTT